MERARGEADFNPSSPHGPGRRASAHLEDARRTLAGLLALGAESRFVFTGGGTQADNLAVLGFARAHAGASPRILVSTVEHKAVLAAAEQAGREGARVESLPVGPDGVVRLEALERALDRAGDAPCLVSVMWANNEIGTVQPVEEIARLARERGARIHTDAVQAFGKIPLGSGDVPVDLLTVTAHKLGGPVGIGGLAVSDELDLAPITHGGAQERGLWPGTQNPLAAVGFAEAARRALEALPDSARRWGGMRDRLAARLREGIPGLVVHGEGAERRLPQLLSVGVPECDAASLLVSLDVEGIAVSSGSACSSGASTPSHVLSGIGVEGPDESYAVVRFSFGPGTTGKEVDRAAAVTVRVVQSLRGRAAVATGGASGGGGGGGSAARSAGGRQGGPT